MKNNKQSFIVLIMYMVICTLVFTLFSLSLIKNYNDKVLLINTEHKELIDNLMRDKDFLSGYKQAWDQEEVDKKRLESPLGN